MWDPEKLSKIPIHKNLRSIKVCGHLYKRSTNLTAPENIILLWQIPVIYVPINILIYQGKTTMLSKLFNKVVTTQFVSEVFTSKMVKMP